MKLKNKIAIITGGGKGIGKEICLGLAKEGAKIIIADLDKENSSNPLGNEKYIRAIKKLINKNMIPK